jgi:phosphoserine / homoserine phosphotransferase
MHIFCSDLEGVFIPEIWINVAIQTKIDDLKVTTRDISDYDVLMKRRIAILKEHGLTIHDIQKVIRKIDPLEGAIEFLDWIRSEHQIIIVSDTFVQFAGPLMEKLGRPTLFCNSLIVAPDGSITGYQLRQKDGKRRVVEALKSLDYRIIAFGDSYNDITMLKKADTSFLFCPPENVKKEFPEIPVVDNYKELKELIEKALHS